MPLWRGGPNTRTLPTVLLTPSASKAADMAHLCVLQKQALGVCRGFVPDIQVCGTHGREDLVNATITSNVEEDCVNKPGDFFSHVCGASLRNLQDCSLSVESATLCLSKKRQMSVCGIRAKCMSVKRVAVSVFIHPEEGSLSLWTMWNCLCLWNQRKVSEEEQELSVSRNWANLSMSSG